MNPSAGPWEPLSGLGVLEISSTPAGAYAGKLFREYGGDVVAVEDPAVDSFVRAYGPHTPDNPAHDGGGLHRYLNAGKRSVAIGSDYSAAWSLVTRLAANADIVIHEFTRDEATQRGLTYQLLRKEAPAVVVLAITPFGEDGPRASWRATEEILFAMSGRMILQGEPERHPVNYAPMIVWSQIATTAAGAAIAAQAQAEETGTGCDVDVSGIEAQLSSVDNLFLMWTFSGWEPPRGLYPPYTYPTADGAILLGAVGPRFLDGMARAAGKPELSSDPRFNTPTALAEHISDFDDEMLPFFLQHDTTELVAILQDHGVLCAPLQSGKTALADPQYTFRRFFQPLDAEIPGLVPGPIARLEADVDPPLPRPAPIVGANTAEVLQEWLGLTQADVEQLLADGVVQ